MLSHSEYSFNTERERGVEKRERETERKETKREKRQRERETKQLRYVPQALFDHMVSKSF